MCLLPAFSEVCAPITLGTCLSLFCLQISPAVFEPRYLELFRTLQANTPAAAEPRFGHILNSSSAPPALMQQSVGGLPPLGVCSTVKSIEELSNGRLQVGKEEIATELGQGSGGRLLRL